MEATIDYGRFLIVAWIIFYRLLHGFFERIRFKHLINLRNSHSSNYWANRVGRSRELFLANPTP